jgi:hypothetical protein
VTRASRSLKGSTTTGTLFEEKNREKEKNTEDLRLAHQDLRKVRRQQVLSKKRLKKVNDTKDLRLAHQDL